MSHVPDKVDEYVYFIYSRNQHDMQDKVQSKVNKDFVPGEVFVNGDWKIFTMISKTASLPMFPDAEVVAKGFKEKMQYKECTSRWKK